MAKDEEIYDKAEDICKLVKLSSKTLYRLAHGDPSFPTLRLGGSIRFPRDRVIRWFRERETTHDEKPPGPPEQTRKKRRRPPMTDALAMLEQVVIGGDLSRLAPADRLAYYKAVCESVGLNPLTRPLEYLTLSGKLVLYARKDATDQLRKKHNVSITKVEHQIMEGIYVVTAYAKDQTDRTDSEIGAVPIDGLKGEARANAIMKAITKAKRRVTLSICGLGMLDETEVEAIPEAQPVAVDPLTGELGPNDLRPFVTLANRVVTETPDATPPLPDRDVLLGQVKAIADKLGLKAPKRAELWQKHCGASDPRTVDVAALQDLLGALRTMGA